MAKKSVVSRRNRAAGTIITAILVGVLAVSSGQQATAAGQPPVITTPVTDENPAAVETGSVVPDADRDAQLGDGWENRRDLAWTIAGDSDALHVLTATANEGYEWQRIASLRVSGFDTDRWIGNACLTSDAEWLAVVFAP